MNTRVPVRPLHQIRDLYVPHYTILRSFCKRQLTNDQGPITYNEIALRDRAHN